MRIHPPNDPTAHRPDPDDNQNPGTPGAPGGESASLHDRVIQAVKTVYDPEIPINIYDLGLIYDVKANEETGTVAVDMTLTTPNCPEAQWLPGQVEQAIKAMPDVNEANVQIVWDPPWTKDRMSDEAKLHLGLM